jgi:hypothetical protein
MLENNFTILVYNHGLGYVLKVEGTF